MNEYRLLLTKDFWSIKNHILEVKNNPKRLGIYLLYIVWIGFMVFNASMQSRSKHRFGGLKDTLGSDIVGAGFTILISTLFFYYLYKGTVESSTFFSMGDVHLLFPSPRSPKKILLYQMVKHSLGQFFVMGFVMLITFPTIIQMTTLDFNTIGYMYLGYIGIALIIGPLNFMIFAMGTKYGIQILLRRVIYGFIILYITFISGYIFYAQSLISGLINALNTKWINYVPIIGWSKSAFMVPILGYSTYGLVSIFLMFVSIFFTIVLCFYMADDYYEDVLGATEKQALRRKIKKGHGKAESKLLFLNKNKHKKISKIGTGPWAMLWRAKVEYSKTDIHPYFSLLTILFILVGIGAGYFGKKNIGTLNPLYFVNGMTAYMLFIFTSIQAKSNELMKPYIFLIPGKPVEKILATNCIEVIRVGISALALNIAMGIILGAPIYLILSLSVFLVSFFILNLSSNYVIRSVYPSAVDQKALFPLFMMVQIVFLLLPGMVLGGIAAFIFKSPISFFMGVTVANIVIISGLLFLANLIFDKIEWR